MNKVDFNQTGGFPLSTNILDAMQTAYSLFNQLGNLAGNYAIISGCEKMGSNISNGVVYINGEVLEFRGGTLSENVIIKQDVENRIFEDGSSKQVIAKRYVTFGTSTPDKTYAWANFKRIKTLLELEAEKVANNLFNQKMDEINQSIMALQNLIAEAKQSVVNAQSIIDNHIADSNNPHTVRAKQVGILKVGTLYIGDVYSRNVGDQWYTWGGAKVRLIEKGYNYDPTFGSDDKYKITFDDYNLGSDYVIMANVTTVDSKRWNNDNDIIVTTGNKQSNSFELYLREVSADTQNIMIDYVIIRKPQD